MRYYIYDSGDSKLIWLNVSGYNGKTCNGIIYRYYVNGSTVTRLYRYTIHALADLSDTIYIYVAY